MKRYRIWEANRKVFLFPENWLEPELRDDKSPFFKEIESQLLQSDISEESATSAYLTYLSKLEEVAKLEPCGMHYIEPTSTQDALMHVVARTPGAHRKYYYRRFEHGTWTAWDQIKLDIPDNPVVPVVWQDRLFLFWLRLLKKGPDSAQKPTPSGDNHLTALTVSNSPGDPNVTVPPKGRPLVPQRDQKQTSSDLVWRSGFRTPDTFIRHGFYSISEYQSSVPAHAGLRFVQRESDPGQQPLRPIQRLCRAAATENHENIDIVNHLVGTPHAAR